jgi:pimeloyl-ACP methyl ester carboxylesterase
MDSGGPEHSVDDMLEFLAHLGRERAVRVGHDWGSPVVWGLASHHPERCEAIANLLSAVLSSHGLRFADDSAQEQRRFEPWTPSWFSPAARCIRHPAAHRVHMARPVGRWRETT